MRFCFALQYQDLQDGLVSQHQSTVNLNQQVGQKLPIGIFLSLSAASPTPPPQPPKEGGLVHSTTDLPV